MPIELKDAIRNALAGSSSRQPVNTRKLYPLGTRKQVEAELLAMYQANEVCCCKIIDVGGENIIWWLSGKVVQPHSYGRVGRSCAA